MDTILILAKTHLPNGELSTVYVTLDEVEDIGVSESSSSYCGWMVPTWEAFYALS